MKILNIHFKNINSLEGETRIDFTEAPFSDTGVFAITGPVEAGLLKGMKHKNVTSAGEMYSEVKKRIKKYDIFIISMHNSYFEY